MLSLERVKAASLLACLLLIAGCGAPEVKEAPPFAVKATLRARIIINFSVTAEPPSDRRFVDQLARDAKARLSYVRPMSGNAHVYEIDGLRDEDELQLALQRLARRPDVASTESDRILRGQ